MDITWKVDQFSKLNRLITESFRVPEDDSESMAETLNFFLEESEIKLASLFQFPKPDPKHLSELEKGVAKINNQEFKVSNDFVSEAKKVSKLLDINEFLAASLVHEGVSYETRLERPTAECAVLLFFSETQKMALCLDNIFSAGVNLSLPASIRNVYLTFSEKLLSSTLEPSNQGTGIKFNGLDTKTSDMFPARILSSITKNKEFSENISSKAKLFESNFGSEVINEIVNSLEEERRILSSIFYTIVSDYHLNSSELMNLISFGKESDISDEITLRITASILSALDTSIQVDSEPDMYESSAFDKTSLLATDPTFLRKLDSEINNSDWKTPELKGLTKLQWSLTTLYGIKRVPGFAEAIGYQEDKAEQHIEEAVLMGTFQFAYEFLLAFKQPSSYDNTNKNEVKSSINHDPNSLNKNINSANSRYPSFTDLDENFVLNLENRLMNLTSTYITRASSVIRKVRYNEEDLILKYQQQQILILQSEQQSASQQWYGAGRLQTPRNVSDFGRPINSPLIPEPKRNTEFLFRFISCLYKDRLDSSLRFWIPSNTGIPDVDDRLLVFIRWGSDMREQGMVESYINMLASLSTGPQSALCAHEFMISGGGKLSENNRIASKLPLCSWESLFGALDFYEQMLQKSKADPLSSNPEIPEAEIKVIEAFLELLKQVVRYSFSARMVIYENKDLQVMWTLFSLLGCPVPVSTKSKILDAISAFASTPYPSPNDSSTQILEEKRISFEICQNVWKLLEQSQALPTASGSPLSTNGQWGWQNNGGIAFELEEIEASTGLFPETRSFLGLLNTLTKLDPNSVPLDDLERDPILFSLHSPSIPSDLGKDYRVPGVSPYISYVLDNVFGKFSQRVYSNDWEKWTIVSSSLTLIERCLATMVLPSKSSKFSISDYQYLVTHPGFEICIRILCGADLIQNLFSIVREGVDSVNSGRGSIGKLISDSVLYALRIFIKILKVQNNVLNLVIPELLESNPQELFGLPLSLPRSLTTLENLFLLQTDVVVHIASYINSIKSSSLCEASVKLVYILSLSSEFNGLNNDLKLSTSGKYITTVNKLVNILEESEESSRIAHGYISRLEQDDGDFFENLLDDSISHPKAALDGSVFGYASGISDKLTSKSSSAVSLSIMNLLLDNLTNNNSYPTIAHWLLGFSLQNISTNDLPDPLTKSTCLHVILNLINQGTSLDLKQVNRNELLINTRPHFAESCYKLVYILSTNSITSEVFLRYLRKSEDFTLSQLQSLLSLDFIGSGTDCKAQMIDFLKNTPNTPSLINLSQFQVTRTFFKLNSYSWFFQYFAHELHISSINGNRSRVQKMIEISLQSALQIPEDGSLYNSSSNYKKMFGSISNRNRFISLFSNMRDAYSECILILALRSKSLSNQIGSDTDTIGIDSENLKILASKYNFDLATVSTLSSSGCTLYNIQTLLSLIKNLNINYEYQSSQGSHSNELNNLVLGCFFSNLKNEIYQSFSQARYGWKQVSLVLATSSWKFISDSKTTSEKLTRRTQLCLDILNSISSEALSPPPPLNVTDLNIPGNSLESENNEIVNRDDEIWCSEMSTMLSPVSIIYSERLSLEMSNADEDSSSLEESMSTSSNVPIEPIVQTWKNLLFSVLSNSAKYSMDLRINIYSSILHFLYGIQTFNTRDASPKANSFTSSLGTASKSFNSSSFKTDLHSQNSQFSPDTFISFKQGFGTLGKPDSQTRSQKLVQRVLDELINSSVGEQVLDCVSTDILDGTDVCKAVSFSLLNTLSALYSVEPRNRLVPYLSRHNYIGQFIDMLRNLNPDLVSLLTPKPNSLNSLHIYESMISFFLRLSYRKMGAERLIEGGILECLSGCDFISCRPQGSISSKNSSDNGLISRLDTYNKLFTPVLNLLCVLLTKIGSDNSQSLNRIYRFITLNYLPFDQILKEASTYDSALTKQILSEAKSITMLMSLLCRHQSIIEKAYNDSCSGVLNVFNLHISAVSLIVRFGISDNWISYILPSNEEDKELAMTPSSFLISLNADQNGQNGLDNSNYQSLNSEIDRFDFKSSVLSQLCISIVNSIISNVVLYSHLMSQPLTILSGNSNQAFRLKAFRPTFAWNIEHCRETDVFPSLASLTMLLNRSITSLQSYQRLLSVLLNKLKNLSSTPMSDLKKLAISALPANSEFLFSTVPNGINGSTQSNEFSSLDLSNDIPAHKIRSLAKVAINREISESEIQISTQFLIIEQALLLLQTHLQHYYSFGNKFGYQEDIYNSGFSNNGFDNNFTSTIHDSPGTKSRNLAMNNGFPPNLVNISSQDLNTFRSDASIVLPSLLNMLDNLHTDMEEKNQVNLNSTPTFNRTSSSMNQQRSGLNPNNPVGSHQSSFIKMLTRRIKSLVFCDD
ncbi:Nuclear pore complex protein [Smittium culicis]|uniref:Nuclear pore complex protein n=1 Tax=Smittium culicis TaxID=133412 RepID=A0A1R1WZX8_9FUNG|nr:Nuclear pore complex protein [Smittium culicis]